MWHITESNRDQHEGGLGGARPWNTPLCLTRLLLEINLMICSFRNTRKLLTRVWIMMLSTPPPVESSDFTVWFSKGRTQKFRNFFLSMLMQRPHPPSPHHHQLLGWFNGESVGSCWPLIWLPAWPITPPAEKAYVVLEEAAAHQLHIFAKRFKKKKHKKCKCCILWEGRQGQTYVIVTFKLYLTYTCIKNVSFALD